MNTAIQKNSQITNAPRALSLTLKATLPYGWQVSACAGQFPLKFAALYRCPRALYYRSRGETETVGGESAHFAERAIDHALTAAGWRAHQPVEITERGVHLRGSADLAFFGSNAQPLRALIFRSVAPHVFDAIEGEGREEDRAVTNMLALGLGAPRWSVCYVDSFDGRIYEHEGPADEKLGSWVLDAFATVAQAQKKGVGPKCPIEHSHRRTYGACTCRTSKFPT